MIADTSKKAYREITTEGLKERQQQQYITALNVLCDIRGDATDSEVSRLLNVPSSTVSARRNELLKKVELSRKRKCIISGRTAQAWRLKTVMPLF